MSIQKALMQYPESYRTGVFARYMKPVPLYQAVASDAPTFNNISRSYGPEAAKFWLRYQIANTFAVIGIYDQVDAAQVRALADDILADEVYGQLTLQEFLSFLAGFRMGKYGKVYSTNRPNMQEFLMALQPFWRELQRERLRYEREHEEEERERKYEEWKRDAVTYEEYLAMKQKDGCEKAEEDEIAGRLVRDMTSAECLNK